MPKANKLEFAFKKEATAVGQAETLAAADVVTQIREGSQFGLDVDAFDTQLVSSTESVAPLSMGQRVVNVGMSYQLVGPGNLTTEPAIAPLLESALFESRAVVDLAISGGGSGTTGTFRVGEPVTFAPSGATGICIDPITVNDARFAFVLLTGDPADNDVATGSISGATATMGSGNEQNRGHVFTPTTWQESDGVGRHGTFRLNRDGYFVEGRGGLSDLSLEFENGRPCIVSQNFLGAWSANGDASFYAPATFPQDGIVAPVWTCADFRIGTYSPTWISSVSIDWPTNPTPIPSPQDCNGGIIYTSYRREAPSLTVSVFQAPTGTKDYVADLFGGTTQPLQFTLGSVAGSTWKFLMPAAQIENLVPGETDPTEATFDLSFRLTDSTTADAPLVIWQK